MTDHSCMKLGRLHPKPTPHLPALRAYAGMQPLPQPPIDIDWGRGTDGWPMLANDTVGDCTAAGVLHLVQAVERWRDGIGQAATDAEALAAYSSYTDYPASDPGAVVADVLAKWRSDGFAYGDAIDRITAYVRVDTANALEMRRALWLFGPLIIGAMLPIAAQTQDVWPSPATLAGTNAPGSWGGHCLLLTGWHDDGLVDLVTWGGVKQARIGWLSAYADEAWAVLHPTWIASGRSPSGWLVDALTANMNQLAP